MDNAAGGDLALDWTRVKRPRTTTVIHSGSAVFLLPEDDPAWFQGYFFPSSSPQEKPWRLLCEQQADLDECLQCQVGEYRQVKMSVYRGGSVEPITLPGIGWTGGDLMRLVSDGVDFTADRLLTGSAAEPFLRDMFTGLMQRVQEYEGQPVGEVLPSAVVVLGSLDLYLPSTEEDVLWADG